MAENREEMDSTLREVKLATDMAVEGAKYVIVRLLPAMAVMFFVFLCVLSGPRPPLTTIQGLAIDAHGQPARNLIVVFLDGEESARTQSRSEIQNVGISPPEGYNYETSIPVEVAGAMRDHISPDPLQPGESWSRMTSDGEHLLVIQNLGDPASVPPSPIRLGSTGEIITGAVSSNPSTQQLPRSGLFPTWRVPLAVSSVVSFVVAVVYVVVKWRKNTPDIHGRVFELWLIPLIIEIAGTVLGTLLLYSVLGFD
jgi:hypothetical protein